MLRLTALCSCTQLHHTTKRCQTLESACSNGSGSLTSSQTSRISAYTSGGMGLLQSTPLSSHANLGCSGLTSNPNFAVLYGAGICPSMGKGCHTDVGVTEMVLPDSVVWRVVVVVAMMGS